MTFRQVGIFLDVQAGVRAPVLFARAFEPVAEPYGLRGVVAVGTVFEPYGVVCPADAWLLGFIVERIGIVADDNTAYVGLDGTCAVLGLLGVE